MYCCSIKPGSDSFTNSETWVHYAYVGWRKHNVFKLPWLMHDLVVTYHKAFNCVVQDMIRCLIRQRLPKTIIKGIQNAYPENNKISSKKKKNKRKKKKNNFAFQSLDFIQRFGFAITQYKMHIKSYDVYQPILSVLFFKHTGSVIYP